MAYHLRKLKRMAQLGSKDEVLSKVLLGGFVDSLSCSALARFVGFPSRDDAEEVLSPDTFEDAI